MSKHRLSKKIRRQLEEFRKAPPFKRTPEMGPVYRIMVDSSGKFYLVPATDEGTDAEQQPRSPIPMSKNLTIQRYRDRKRFCVCGPRLRHGGQTLYFIGTKQECLDYLKGEQGTAKLKTPPLHPDRA
jgi:hypothetical protein